MVAELHRSSTARLDVNAALSLGSNGEREERSNKEETKEEETKRGGINILREKPPTPKSTDEKLGTFHIQRMRSRSRDHGHMSGVSCKNLGN
jgi:hypothetical protein